MHEILLDAIYLTLLATVFLLGWTLGSRRRARLNKIAALAAKLGHPKVENVEPTQKPFFKLDVVKQGVIELHNSWRQKGHGLH